MNLKQAFTFATALTCLAPNICVASAAQSRVVADSEQDSRYQSTPHASTSLDGVSIANDNRILQDDHGDTDKFFPALDKSRCKDSPLKLLLETTGGSIIAFKCTSMVKNKNTSCSDTGVLASHCPKACGMCPMYKCSDSKGTFLMGKGRDRNCSWLAGKIPKQKRILCKKPSVAETCRATCKFCPSDDTESNQPSIELSMVPSAVPSFVPSLVSTNAPSPSEKYPNCNLPDNYYDAKLGNGECDNTWPYNTAECGWDDGDCVEFNSLYPNCHAIYAYEIGDGRCDDYYNTQKCGYDGGDCPRKYPNCDLSGYDDDLFDDDYNYYYDEAKLGDGECDNWPPYNTAECGWDGGDCVEFNSLYPNCPGIIFHIGDGTCDDYYNTVECGYDGGDCL